MDRVIGDDELSQLNATAYSLAIVTVMQEQIRDLEIENRIYRKALAEIATESYYQPTTYDDVMNGTGQPVPTRSAQLAKKALGYE